LFSGEINCYTNLQNAVNDAQYGEEVVLQAGATFNGLLNLPFKNGTGWINYRTSNLNNLPPEGNRVTPDYAISNGKNCSSRVNDPALQMSAGAHNYRIVGIEFTKANPQTIATNLILAGTGLEDSISLLPHDIVLIVYMFTVILQ